MKKAVITTLFCLFLASAFPAAAHAQELVAGGQVVGIQISTEGVMVADVAPVETAGGSVSPAADAGVCKGDFIVALDGEEIGGAGELISAVGARSGASVELTVQREDKTLRLSVQPALSSENQWMLGMWLRDGISGIGTVTFYDPSSGEFGALGHSISDADTGVVVPLRDGSISDAQIVSISKGAAGAPGELNGCADISKALGSVDRNTGHGIFGRSFTTMGGRVVETGEIRTGKASILSTIDGRETEEYSVDITRVYSDADGCHVMLTVTDSALCAKTGGIVQGMSGSPILQNGKLVGAVTHVFVNDPTRGYGVSIQDMLSAAGIEEKAA
ncbi:MAG: SpoIVB peptidase [Oscillospiraceae bacterium]|nr:SpoIVB peptidase [Oscillospiraceae bacterium]